MIKTIARYFRLLLRLHRIEEPPIIRRQRRLFSLSQSHNTDETKE